MGKGVRESKRLPLGWWCLLTYVPPPAWCEQAAPRLITAIVRKYINTYMRNKNECIDVCVHACIALTKSLHSILCTPPMPATRRDPVSTSAPDNLMKRSCHFIKMNLKQEKQSIPSLRAETIVVHTRIPQCTGPFGHHPSMNAHFLVRHFPVRHR